MLQPPAERIATCYCEAMFGYAEAASAMWWAVTHASIDTCASMVKAASKDDGKPKSWFNPEAAPALFGGDRAAFDWFGNATGALPSLDIWFDMFPLRGGPAAWPMAFGMLSAGVPKAVAWPAAAANAAMMEAAEVASGEMQNAFASYHSESGYAAAANANGVPYWKNWAPTTPTIAAYRA